MNDYNTASEWLRWDVHIHTPGTVMEDRYDGDWEKFLTAIEDAEPPVIALGITDYCCLDSYEKFLTYRNNGRVADVELVFPNIEFRLTPSTSSGNPINIHILISPDDVDHVDRVKEALIHLTVEIKHTNIGCDHSGLVRLGKIHRGKSCPEQLAYKEGIGQFKVDVVPFLEWYGSQHWLRENSLLAVAGGNDGLAGLRRDSGFKQKHDELVRNTHLILSATPSDTEYFLGKGTDSPDVLTSLFGGLRPCLHGCDAHRLEDVLDPDKGRFCWIKAAPSFDGLRQVQYEPESRVYIGKRPAAHPDPDRVIRSVSVRRHRGWFVTEDVEFSPFLNAIIGEKGTGKTALADLVAVVAGAWHEGLGSSFLSKALHELAGAEVKLCWASGREQSISLQETPELSDEPAVRYLSQQFVERLCSKDLLAQELVEEVERVVFDHIPESERLNTGSFDELRTKLTADLKTARTEIRQDLIDVNMRVQEGLREVASLKEKHQKLASVKAEVERLNGELGKRLSEEDQTTVASVNRLRSSLSELEGKVAGFREHLNKLGGIRSRISRIKERFDELHLELRHDLEILGVSPDALERFQPMFKGDVDSPLDEAEANLKTRIQDLQESGKNEEGGLTISGIKKQLGAEEKKLKLDEQRRQQVTRLQSQVTSLQGQTRQLESEIKRLEEIKERDLPRLRDRRMQQYLGYFKLLHDERRLLESLYQPLKTMLSARESEEKDLDFDVASIVDIRGWSQRGEAMLDLRRIGEFSQPGALEAAGDRLLRDAWTTGDETAIRTGIEAITDGIFQDSLRDILRTDYTWNDISDWLYSVDHIRLDYTLKYRGTDLRYLSPGTRGIVLLILYLAADQFDDRPLVMDQPEENLDNASVYEVLVDYFRAAKKRRQIVIVTHNPNLVVNTDAEKVIVARAERRETGLPAISYHMGPLEATVTNGSRIRDSVCKVLEGGRVAFMKREQRYELDSERSA